MAAFIFEGRDKTQRTGHEKIAMRNIRYAIDWIVGGYYNSLQDGYIEDLPESKENLVEEIYESAMIDAYADGAAHYGRAPREMRFAGEKFVRAYIDWRLANDEETAELIAEIEEAARW